MSNAVFGKAILRSFIADDRSNYLTLPSQAPTIYVFDYQPSDTQARAGTNAIATISTWTQTGTNNTYTIPAIDDPEPSGAVIEKEYWEAILYRLETGEQQQLKLRMFYIVRADALESVPATTKQDIKDVWNGVTSYISDAQLDAYLPLAETEMRMQVGLSKWSTLSKLSEAKIVLAYKTIELMAAFQVAKGNQDKFVWLHEYAKEKYNSLFSKLHFPEDADRDGFPEQVAQESQMVVILNR